MTDDYLNDVGREELGEYREPLSSDIASNGSEKTASDKFEEQLASLTNEFHKACSQYPGAHGLILLVVEGNFIVKETGHSYDVATAVATYLRTQKRALFDNLEC